MATDQTTDTREEADSPPMPGEHPIAYPAGPEGGKTRALHARVFQAILAGDYQPGDRLPPEREMALASGVSRVTVRRAYAELEQAGVIERSRKRGTFVSTRLQGRPTRSGTVALLTADLDPFSLEFIGAMERSLTAAGLLLVLKVSEESAEREAKAALDLVSCGVRDLVIWPSAYGFAASTFERLRILGVNMVFFDRVAPGPYADFIGVDNAHAMRSLMEHACAAGMRHPILVAYEGLDVYSLREREEAFHRFCAQHRLEGRVVRLTRQHLTPRQLSEACPAWMADTPDAAIFCVNDLLAVQIRGVLPRARIYGIDGYPEALAAGVISYRQPYAHMASKTVEMLRSQRSQGEHWRARRLLCKGDLVLPATAACPPGW